MTFQDLILTLQNYWASKGCVIHQPYDTEVGAGTFHPAVLSWYATTVLDVRGIYLAELRDDTGAPAGWLRVSISPYLAAPRIYDGVLPAAIQEPLAIAAAELIDADVDYIEGRAVNPYLGN